MIFDLPMFTLIHVVISVLGIISGLVVVGGLMAGARLEGWTAFFLATTLFTSLSGFGFPFTQVSPAHIVGHFTGGAGGLPCRPLLETSGRLWRATYVITAVTALYLNTFVLVVQLFVKTPPLAQLAPTQQEPPFAVTQVLILALFVYLGWAALRGFRPTRFGF
ncbi:MAG: hypothetical protein HZT40_21330 [Candidatus Thiothrix singaporensis]|uniref:Uncharacterized protein n=1 Tax=Candidatus Thiothrix singaporensis TaxID=2799669 RepID=A0A7L6AXK6_9GAMM|nr:MAG: hypothetical protein HZT40_21330 [Candidatus Thiothrix singaporensis]